MLPHQRAWLLAIGRRLRADYHATAEPIPPRLWSHGSPMTILNVGGGGMVSNHRLVLFTHVLCRLSYPAACGPLGEGSGGRGACRSPKGPRHTLSAGERSITSATGRSREHRKVPGTKGVP